MKTIDLESPTPDQKTVLQNQLTAWQLRKQQRFASPDQFDSQVWLDESLLGLELAIGSNNPELITDCLAQCLAFGCASVVATAMSAESLRITLPGESPFVCKHLPCLPSQWLRALMAAVVADDLPKLSLLAGNIFNEINNRGEVCALSIGRAFSAIALGQVDADQLLDQACSHAVSETESLVNALVALHSGQTAELQDLNGLESLALSTLNRYRQQPVSCRNDKPINSMVREPAPQLVCILPVRAVLHDREPHWYLDLHGYSRDGRKYRLLEAGNAVLLGIYTVNANVDMPGVEAPFELHSVDRSTRIELAIDAGELMFLSDWYAEQAGVDLVSNIEKQREQRNHKAKFNSQAQWLV